MNLVPFSHHLTALEWAKQNAGGNVMVFDSWTYGYIEVFPDGGWQTVNHLNPNNSIAQRNEQMRKYQESRNKA